MLLTELIRDLDVYASPGTSFEHRDVTGISSDSRHIRPGFVFAALAGTRTDGRLYIDEAVRRGAVAVLAPHGTTMARAARPIPVITDDNPRRLYALLAARFHRRQPETVVAVTGTNGKTSVTAFARQLWAGLAESAASIGTIGVVAPGLERPGSLTTPDPADLHALMAELAARGVRCLAMEASSHGLEQCRLDGLRLSAAAFTNLSRDHLDYHGTMAAYRQAKLRLFRDLLPAGGLAVANGDDPAAPAIRALCRDRGLRLRTFGARTGDFRLAEAVPRPEGQDLNLLVDGKTHAVRLPLVGEFQALNAICALAVVTGLGAPVEAAIGCLGRLTSVRGRLELAGRHAAGAPVYVDYAHTPDALDAALKALRAHVRGRLVLVFGCGGDRDPGKRPQMGRIAAALADRVIVTDDNPRGEDPTVIRRQTMKACPQAIEIGDRRGAIREAVASLKADDVMIVAGKGHEQGQKIGDTTVPFDDAEEVRSALAEDVS